MVYRHEIGNRVGSLGTKTDKVLDMLVDIRCVNHDVAFAQKFCSNLSAFGVQLWVVDSEDVGETQ